MRLEHYTCIQIFYHYSYRPTHALLWSARRLLQTILVSVEDPRGLGGLTPPPRFLLTLPPPRGFVFACQFENSSGPAFSGTLNPRPLQESLDPPLNVQCLIYHFKVRNELLLFCKRWCVCPCAGFRRSFFDDHRRVGTDSNLKDRCLDMQGYMYMCQRSARNSLSFQGRRSLPDVIDSVCMSKTTRTTSLGSNLQEREYRLSLHSNRLSTDITHLHPDFPQGRRLSTKSLPVQCTCNPKQAGSCACANGVLRNNLAPLLRLSPEHSSTSGGLTGTDATLFEEPEIQAQSKQETNSDVAL